MVIELDRQIEWRSRRAPLDGNQQRVDRDPEPYRGATIDVTG
jgi:hypothetical protein